MSEEFKYDVFLSHSSKDKPAVRELAERLRRDGLRVWLDEWEIRPGDPILLKIEEGLEQSRTLVLAMSANAFTSEWVTLERHTALFRDPTNNQRRFIPLRLDDAEIKDTLRQFAYVDWRLQTDEQYAKLLVACKPPLADRLSSKGQNYADTATELHKAAFSVEQYLLELDRIYYESRIEDWYVKLDGSVQLENGSRHIVDVGNYVDEWLVDPARHHLAILGDYGTGKSWFCLRLAKRLADQYQLTPQQTTLPLLISFRRYQKKMDFLDLIKPELFDGYGVELLNPAILRRLLQTQ